MKNVPVSVRTVKTPEIPPETDECECEADRVLFATARRSPRGPERSGVEARMISHDFARFLANYQR